jgi:hypothetical protein
MAITPGLERRSGGGQLRLKARHQENHTDRDH